MRIVLLSQEPDIRAPSAKAFLEEVKHHSSKDTIACAHLIHKEFELTEKEKITLATLGITSFDQDSTPLTKADLTASRVIAMDQLTRESIQESFGILVPLYNEIAKNRSEDVEKAKENDQIISTLHYLQETAPHLLKNIKI